MPRIQFHEDVAAALEWYVPEEHGQPSGAAALTIYTSGSSELTGSWPASVSLDAAAGTAQSAASAGAQSLTVDTGEAATFTVGRTYLATSTLGQIVQLKIKGVDTSAETLYLEQPLAFALAAGSTLAGHRYAYSLTTTHTATRRRRVRARWTYTAASVTRTADQYFDIVREPFDLHIRESDLEEHDPYWGEYAGGSGRWRSLLSGALGDLERALSAHQLYPDLLRDREMARDALCFAVLSKWHKAAGRVDLAASWREDFDRAVADLVKAKVWYDADDDHVVDVDGIATEETATGTTAAPPMVWIGGVATAVGGEDELGVPASYARVG